MLVCAALAGGCNNANGGSGNGHELIPIPPNTLSVYQLAGRLNMSVVEATKYSATLRNASNTVMVYSDPGGQAFVNGRPIGQPNGFPTVSGILFVPQDLEGPIRSVLRPATGPVVAVRPPREGPIVPGTEKPPPVRGKLSGKVVIDPGHGGKDPGTLAAGRGGRKESAVNLALATGVADRLKQRGASAILTRKDDTFLELEDRSAIASRAGADLFVSLHCNSVPNPGISGFSVHVARSASASSAAAARAIERNLSAAGVSGRGLVENNFRVLVQSACPAVLVECGYLSNPAEASRLGDPGYQAKVAEAVANGIAEYLQRR
jgi:N-acetylmuramoyl-L-alanine amidase